MGVGRKRKAGKREPNGRIQRASAAADPSRDFGTPEQQLRKVAAWGDRAADPAKLGRELECPVDLLEARLGPDRYSAARLAVSILRRESAAIGSPRMVGSPLRSYLPSSAGPGMTDEARIDARKAADKLRAVIAKHGRFGSSHHPAARAALRDLRGLADGQMPARQRLRALEIALDAIADRYGLRDAPTDRPLYACGEVARAENERAA